MKTTLFALAYVAQGKLDLNEIQNKLEIGILKRKEAGFLLFEIQSDSFVYIKNFGAIVYFNVDINIIGHLNAKICEITKTSMSDFQDEISVRLSDSEDIDINFDELVIPRLSLNYVHIICLNLSQSVALFYYQSLSDQLLSDTKKFTTEMEQKGRVSLKRKQLMKFIGSTLNIKNKIAEHLYIFDSPNLAWDDENINKVDRLLNENLEIKYRYNATKEQLNIVKENLDHFKDLNLHQHSSLLEWIIIILILFEVIHVLIEKIILS